MEFIHPATDEQVDKIQEILASDPGQGIVTVRGDHPLYHIIVREGGAIIAIASIDSHIGELWKLYVAPGYKGRGVGTALVNKVIDLLREGCFEELLVEMTEQSFPFWEKFVSGRTFTQTDFNKINIAISRT